VSLLHRHQDLAALTRSFWSRNQVESTFEMINECEGAGGKRPEGPIPKIRNKFWKRALTEGTKIQKSLFIHLFSAGSISFPRLPNTAFHIGPCIDNISLACQDVDESSRPHQYIKLSTNRSVAMLQLQWLRRGGSGTWKRRKALPCWIHYSAPKDACVRTSSNVHWKVSDERSEIQN